MKKVLKINSGYIFRRQIQAKSVFIPNRDRASISARQRFLRSKTKRCWIHQNCLQHAKKPEIVKRGRSNLATSLVARCQGDFEKRRKRKRLCFFEIHGRCLAAFEFLQRFGIREINCSCNFRKRNSIRIAGIPALWKILDNGGIQRSGSRPAWENSSLAKIDEQSEQNVDAGLLHAVDWKLELDFSKLPVVRKRLYFSALACWSQVKLDNLTIL